MGRSKTINLLLMLHKVETLKRKLLESRFRFVQQSIAVVE